MPIRQGRRSVARVDRLVLDPGHGRFIDLGDYDGDVGCTPPSGAKGLITTLRR